MSFECAANSAIPPSFNLDVEVDCVYAVNTLTLYDVDYRTAVLILGTARSNYGDPGERASRRIHERAKRVLWLNPEPRAFWNSGDSVMHALGACCDRVESCRTLVHLERIVSEIARTAV